MTPEIFQFQPDGMTVSQPVRTVTIDGEPWFVAKDVCDVLDHSNSRRALDALDNDEKGVTKVYTLGGQQSVNIVSESGLYALVMRSNKPEAKAFRKWITGTVLPAIRKTGSYAHGEEHLDPSAPDYMDRLKDLLLAAQERKLEAAQAKIETLQPKAEAFAVIEEATGALLVRDAAKSLKSTEKKLYGGLESFGWVTKKTKRKLQRQATAAATRQGYMTTKTAHDTWGNVRTTPMVTPKGLAWLAQRKAERQQQHQQTGAAA